MFMYEFHYNYIKNKYDNKLKLLFTDTDSLIYEIKTENVYEDFSSDKKMFGFSNYSKYYYNNLNKLVFGKMKDETGGVAIEEFFELKLRMYSFLVDNSEHKKVNGVNRNVIATISHNEYKNVLLNNKCIRHSMDRIQIKDHRIGTYEINKILLSCFDDKVCIEKKRMCWISSWLSGLIRKNSYLNNHFKKGFLSSILF